MSGIAGLVCFNRAQADERIVGSMLTRLGSRGGDVRGTWSDGPVALGCNLRRVTVQSQNEVQPLIDRDSGTVVVMDGRLDRRADLIRTLGCRADNAPVADSELVLNAWRRWGQRCVEHLLGDYAFAIWDPAEKRLFCVRDRMGGGGFAYFQGDGFFGFASVSTALACLPGFDPAPNPNYIACLLVPPFQNRGSTRSWLMNAEVLMPAESLTVTVEGSIKRESYWSYEPLESRKYRSYEECEEHFVETFNTALRDRMVDPGNFGVLMSGGLDSAGLVAAMHRSRPDFPAQDLVAFSAISDEPDACIESRSILSMADSLNLQFESVSVPSMTGMVDVEDLMTLAWKNPHPVNNAILIPSLMCLAASRKGHRLVLHGACGDLAMNAPWYYPAELVRRGRLDLAWRESRAAAANNYFLEGKSVTHILSRSAVLALPGPLIGWIRKKRYLRRGGSVEPGLLNPEFLIEMDLDHRLKNEVFEDLDLAAHGERERLLHRSFEGICSALSAFNGISGAFGMQGGDPWSDLRVLDFFYRLPIEYLVREGWTKFPVRSAFAAELSSEVRWRKDKTHLGWLVTKRLMDQSRDRVEQTIFGPGVRELAPYVDISLVQELTRRYLNRDGHDDRQRVFEFVSLALWLGRLKQL